MKKNSKIKLELFLVFFITTIFIFPGFISAQSMSLKSEKDSYKIGEYASVFLVLDTNDISINTIEAAIQIPKDFFELSSILTGDSFLSLWPERPAETGDGIVGFIGGVPGGFTGANGKILTLILQAKKSGQASIGIKNASVLLNDGLSTELKNLKLNFLTLNISGEIKKGEEKPLIDTAPPESFTPIISQNPSVANNKYFVSFSAQDKESGIAYYEVREGYAILPFLSPFYFTKWEKIQNPPYILNYQHWWTRVYVRAYDNAGNYREESVLKPIDKKGAAALYAFIIILLIIILLFFIKYLKSRNAPS